MPRKPKEKPLFEDVPESPEDIDFETFLEQIAPGTSRIDIFRVTREGSTARVDRVELSVMLDDPYGYIYENYGAGKYELHFKGSDGRYRGGKRVVVDDKRPVIPGQAAPEKASGTGDFWEKMIAMQSAQNTALLSALKGPDMGTLLAGLAAMVGALKPASTPDPAGMLTAVATVFATLRGPKTDEDWLERSSKIIEMAKNLIPDGGGGGDSWAGIARDVSKVVMDKLTPAPGATPAAAELRPFVPAALPAATIPAPGPIPTPMATTEAAGAPAGLAGQNVMDWIRVCLAYLKEKAKLAKDPDFYVEWLLENDDEPQCAAVVGAIGEGATFEQLLAFDAEIGQNPAYYNWFKRVFDGVSTDLQKSMDSSGAGRHAPNALDHAGTGTPGSELAPSGGNGRAVS